MRSLLITTIVLAAAAWGGVAFADAASEAALKAQLDQAQSQLAQYKDGFEKASQALTQMQAERDQARTERASAARSLEYCQAKNVYLIALGENILAHRISRNGLDEPFTGLVRVRLENAQQEYEDKVRAGRFDPRLDHPVSQAQPAAAAADAPAPAEPDKQKH